MISPHGEFINKVSLADRGNVFIIREPNIRATDIAINDQGELVVLASLGKFEKSSFVYISQH